MVDRFCDFIGTARIGKPFRNPKAPLSGKHGLSRADCHRPTGPLDRRQRHFPKKDSGIFSEIHSIGFEKCAPLPCLGFYHPRQTALTCGSCCWFNPALEMGQNDLNNSE
jgi:hypothetical protein